MYSLKNILAFLFALLALTHAFVPSCRSSSTTNGMSTQLGMGLFDFVQPPKKGASSGGGGKGEKGGKKMDKDVFGGRGAKITIREDEDAAMWIDEPKADKKKGK
jgi:hypothetical protein